MISFWWNLMKCLPRNVWFLDSVFEAKTCFQHYLIYNFNLWKTLQKVQCKTLIGNFKWYFASFPGEDFIIFYLIGKEVYGASSNCRRPWGRFRAGGGITYLIWPVNLFRSPRIRPCREADSDNQKKIDKLIDIKTFISKRSFFDGTNQVDSLKTSKSSVHCNWQH